MANNGWKALIYDAEWARFKKGQEGVIVSEDGRMCETLDDNRDNILIEADPNLSFSTRTSGHILFRQKGTDLFDIVCLEQVAGGKLELLIDKGQDAGSTKIEMNVCNSSVAEYNSIINILDKQNYVKIRINYNDAEAYSISHGDGRPDANGKDTYVIKTPLLEEFINAANEVIETNETKAINLIVRTYKYGDWYESNVAELVLNPPAEPTPGDYSSYFNFTPLLVVEHEPEGSSSTEVEPIETIFYTVEPSDTTINTGCDGGEVMFNAIQTKTTCTCAITKSPTTELPCKGGSVSFVINCNTPEKKDEIYYSINFNNCIVKTKYKLKTCSNEIDKEEDGYVSSVTLLSSMTEPTNGRVTLRGEITNNIMELIIDLDVERFVVKVTSNLGYSCNAIFVKNNNGYKIENDICTSSE